MTISMIIAWITVLAGILSILKYPARKLKKPKINRFFHRIHIPCGIIMLLAGTAHALFAGNPYNATLTDFTPFAALLSANWGTACLVLIQDRGRFLVLLFTAVFTAASRLINLSKSLACPRTRNRPLSWFPLSWLAVATYIQAMAMCR